MKNERGSALLIVMLIVFVTATIGAAVSSFILYNYKLRSLDNTIGRAEYEAEKIIDTAYIAAQEAVKDNIDSQLTAANEKILEEYNAEKATATVDGDYNYGRVEDGVYISNTAQINNAISSEFTALYKDKLGNKLKAAIYNKVEDVLDVSLATTYDEDTFGKSENKEVAIVITETKGDKIVETINIYYKIPGSPLIRFSADFVISIPTYYEVDTRTYKLDELVGITNWEMHDWGYL